jgi:hypothetical protein
MKKAFLFVIVFASSIAFAIQKNPLIRTCNTLGGEFVVANAPQDQIAFCRFGKALVGALDLMLFNNKETITQSINSYMKSQTSCDPLGRIETMIILGGGASYQVCTYPDGSLIELGTLIKGSTSTDNSKLNTALGL